MNRSLKLMFACVTLFAFTIGIDFFSFSLPDLQNKSFSFSSLKNNKATVIVMLLSDCPASQSYTLTINDLLKKYSKDNIAFVGIFPGKYASDEELNNFKKTYKINFPLLKDPDNSLVKQLRATTAPGCFVIDQKGTIVYRGRIDNWFYAVGSTRTKITEHNLDDALQSIRNNTEIKVKETKPMGCILEYE